MIQPKRQLAHASKRGLNLMSTRALPRVARFFFKITNDAEELPEMAFEFAAPDEAWTQAIMTAGEMLRDLGAKFRPGTGGA
jgi:hypothetical protein